MLTGTRFPHGHPQLQKLLKLSDDYLTSQQIGGSGLAVLFPILLDYAPTLTGFKKYYESAIAFQQFFGVMKLP